MSHPFSDVAAQTNLTPEDIQKTNRSADSGLNLSKLRELAIATGSQIGFQCEWGSIIDLVFLRS